MSRCLGNHQSCHPSESDTNSYQVHTLSSCALEPTPKLPQPIHATLVTVKQPQEKSLAHSALLQLQAQPARPHSTPIFLPASFSWPLCLRQASHGEHCVSCGWTLCAYGNIIGTVSYSKCILIPLTKGLWVSIHISTERLFHIECVYA